MKKPRDEDTDPKHIPVEPSKYEKTWTDDYIIIDDDEYLHTRNKAHDVSSVLMEANIEVSDLVEPNEQGEYKVQPDIGISKGNEPSILSWS